MNRLVRVAAICWIFFASQGSCSTAQLNNIHLDFVEFLGQQSSSWNYSDPATVVHDRLCLDQLELFSSAFSTNELWAVNIFDSWGKIPAGALFGNVYEFGNFDQCRRAQHAHYYGVVFGQHCTLMVDVGVLNLPIGPIWHGICMPDVCRPRMVGDLANMFLQGHGMRVVNDPDMFCYKNEDSDFSAITITAIVLFSCYAAVLILATAVEFLYIWSTLSAPPFVKRFSVYNNVMQVFTTVPQSKAKSQMMDCVNGIRALSMLWIVVNHVHDTAYGLPAVNSTMRTEYSQSYFGVLFHRLGGKAVDIFLMLSGMLVTMKVLRELDQSSKLNIPKLWIHRIVRITPAYAAMILFALAFTNYFGEGILYKAVAAELTESCSKSWWSALLYVQNYVHPKEMCFPHTWYLSVDMQLYILSPLILIPLWRFGKRFTPIIVFVALLSISCVFTTFMVNNYRLNKAAPVGDGLMPRKTYHPTHARMSVWLFGVIFGYYLHRTKSRTVWLSRTARSMGWILAAAVVVLTGYSLKQLYTGDYTTIPAVADAFYESLHRSFWAFAVMWVIFMCVNQQGGVVNQFLSWRFWQPVSKLSYTMYLLHILIQVVGLTMLLKAPVYFSTLNILYNIFGLVGISAAAATVWSVAFEYPFFGAERIFFREK